MIIVDSSVWIDYFNGQDTAQTNTLDVLLDVEPVAIGDLILTEVLQGFRSDIDFKTAKELMLALTIYEMLSVETAIAAAENFRALRKRGLTVRKTNDVIIATFCIQQNHALLFSDRDFEPFVKHLGLKAFKNKK
jgi:predicted nucleic acid-binding protein